MARFGIWFTGEVIGLWVVWASYMAIKFMTEVGQGQKASWSLHTAAHQQPGSVGLLFIVPLFLSIIGSLVWTIVVGTGEFDD